MKKLLLILALSCQGYSTFAQTNSDPIIRQGIDLHNRGYFEEAILKYDSVLSFDKSNYTALYEKSYTLMELKKYDASIALCKQILKEHPAGKDNGLVYVNYGTCMDMINKPQAAIDIYNEGIKKHPEQGMLYYNKAITCFNTNQRAKGIEATKYSVLANKYHPSSHNLLSLVHDQKNKIYAIMAGVTFLIIEPQSERAKDVLKRVQDNLGANVKQTGDKAVSINLNASALDDKKGKKEPDNFKQIEMMMSFSQALHYSDEFKNMSAVQKTEKTLESIISSLALQQKDGKGFSWDFYAPFFIDLKKEAHLETLSHVIYASANDSNNGKWLKQNKEKVDAFYAWFRKYPWPKIKI